MDENIIVEETIIETPVIVKAKEYRPNPLLIPLSIILAGALIAGSVIYNGRIGTTGSTVATTSPTTTTTAPTGFATVTTSLNNAHIEGDSNAKVAVIEFGDYQCPYCEQFYTQDELSIKSNYVDKSKVQFAFKDFPLTSIHQYAQIGSEAAWCAGEQSKYWEMHNILYEHTAGTNDATAIKGFAQTIGLNTDQFSSCLDAKKYDDKIAANTTDGNTVGVQGTPSILIGKIDKNKNTVTGVLVPGAYPLSTVQPLIDKALKS